MTSMLLLARGPLDGIAHDGRNRCETAGEHRNIAGSTAFERLGGLLDRSAVKIAVTLIFTPSWESMRIASYNVALRVLLTGLQINSCPTRRSRGPARSSREYHSRRIRRKCAGPARRRRGRGRKPGSPAHSLSSKATDWWLNPDCLAATICALSVQPVKSLTLRSLMVRMEHPLCCFDLLIHSHWQPIKLRTLKSVRKRNHEKSCFLRAKGRYLGRSALSGLAFRQLHAVA